MTYGFGDAQRAVKNGLGSALLGFSNNEKANALGNLGMAHPIRLHKWRLALAKVRDGQARAKVLHLGESTTLGYGAGTGSPATVNARAKSHPAKLASILSGMGIPSHHDGFFGVTFGSGGTDSRLTLGAGWAAGATLSIGGFIVTNSTTTNAVTFTPTGAVDSFDVWWAGATGLNTLAMSVDGGAATNVPTGGAASAFSKTTIAAGSPGTHTLSIARTATGTGGFICGIDAYDSTTKKVSQVNAGASGLTLAALTNNSATQQAWYPYNAIPVYAPDLTVINMSINDANAATDLSTWSALYQTLIQRCQITGDVVLIVPHPTTGSASVATQNAFRQAILALGAANGCVVVDLWSRFPDYATSNTLGFMYDTLHLNALGYADVAQVLATTLNI